MPSTRPAAAPTSGRRPRVGLSLAALALGGFGIGTTEFATMGVLPDIASGTGQSIPTAGHLISAYALGVVVGAPLLAVAGARLPRKALLLLLMTAFAAANLASALAPGFGTLLAARFLSGLPHGAYFGIASVVAASLVAPQRRGWAVSMMMLGLTVANVLGVPVSTLLGQGLGWRSTFAVVAVIGALTVAAVALLVPPTPLEHGASAARELGALGRLQVWLTLLVGAVGFGGFFAVYSYITPTLTDVTGYRESAVPVVLAVFGIGMTLGNLLGGRLADWSVDRSIAGGLVAVVVVLATFPLTARSVVPAAVSVLLLGATGSAMIPALQTRLMDVAGDAQSLAAAANHSALNIANALGAWLGGVVIAAGHGYTSPALVGVGLALGGLLVLGAAVAQAGLTRRPGRLAQA
ncbi:MFS transporter [Motilibacter peucedani]|uniref:MFS transporter n=1 Tax=Motilibacter peucedani TaxID=598650 RepID=UPI0038B2F0A6